jgi:hypothetical protein
LVDLQAFDEGDGGLQVVALLARDAQFLALNRNLNLQLGLLNVLDDPLGERGVDALFDDDLLTALIARGADGVFEPSADGSILRRVKWTFTNSSICSSFGASSARIVRTDSLRSMVQALSLKSKRVAISRRMPAIALSTSARSVFETMSKDGMGEIPQASDVLNRIGD